MRTTRIIAVFFLLAAACSDDSSTGGSGGDADRDLSAGDVGVDLGPSPDVTADQDATADQGSDAQDEAAAVTIGGLVAVFETRAPAVAQLDTGGLAAGFIVTEPSISDPPVATVGDCVITVTDPDSPLFPDDPTLDAGDITVTLGPDELSLSLEQTDDGPRYRSNAPEERIEFFSAGLTVRYAAAGGADVAAFSGSVSAPAEPVVSQPAWGSSTDGTHSPDAALNVGWAPTNVGDAVISLVPIEIFPEPGVAEGNAITCTVPDSGAFTVPTEALDYLPGGGFLGPNVALTVVVAVTNTIQVGDAEVALNATASHSVVGAIRE